MTPDIVAIELVKVYRTRADEVQALRGLTLHVKHSQMISIIGPSGSGKTTLLNILGGLDKPTAGSVKIGEQELQVMKPADLTKFRQKNIGHVLQGTNLLPYLTAEENVELPMLAAGVSRTERMKRAVALLETIGLPGRSSHKPDELSGGEKQRVAIASALANDPAILLADEPTGELDTANASLIVNLLSDVSKKFEKTVVMVTHDPKAAQKSDSIFLIEDGRIKSTITPSKIFSEGSYIDGLNARILEIESQMADLDSSFQNGRMTPSAFVESRRRLEMVKDGLKQELNRLGIVD